MLEIRKYTKNELSAVLETNTKQGIDRKLQRYGVEFVSIGRGQNLMYEIQKVPDRFKLFCITEMGISANADFTKLRNFCYYIFCDDEFAELPIVEMERIMSEDGVPMARQSISKWIEYLERIDYISLNKTDCKYYAITKTPDNQKHYTEISKELYCKGWALYWKTRNIEGTNTAYQKMFDLIGGHPCKRPKMEHNAIYQKEIEKLIELVNESFLE